jgi:hypothetical protein
MARSRLPCCDGHHGSAFLRRLDAELFERGAESHQACGGAVRCDPNAQSAENHKSVMAVTAAQSGSVPYPPPTSQLMEQVYDHRNQHWPDKQASAQIY